MNSDQLACLSKARLQNLKNRRGKSLQQLAMDCIVENVSFFIGTEKDLFTAYLSNCMKDRVIQHVLKLKCSKGEKKDAAVFNNFMSLLPLLLSPKTMKLDLTGLFSFCPNKLWEKQSKLMLAKVVGWIVQLAPNIEELIFIGRYSKGPLTDFEVGELCKMRQLKKLVASCVNINWRQLLSLGRMLPKLRVLAFASFFPKQEETDMVDAEQIKRDLGRLRILVCHIKYEVRGVVKKLLPELDTFESPKQFWLTFDDIIAPEDDISRSHTSNLPKYFEVCDRKDVSAAAHCQNITRLMINLDSLRSRTLNALLMLTKVESLTMTEIQFRAPLVERFLAKHGPNLHTLKLSVGLNCDDFDENEFYNRMSFKRIFELCPKLERLSLNWVLMQDDRETFGSFAQLKELSWKASPLHECLHLSSILSAPNLRKVRLQALNFERHDMRRLRLAMAKRQVLGQLESLHFEMTEIPVRDSECDFNFESFREIKKTLKVASAFLPQLTHLEFTVQGQPYKKAIKEVRENEDRYYHCSMYSVLPGFENVVKSFTDRNLVHVLDMYKE